MKPGITKAATTSQNFHEPTLYYRSAREGFTDALRALLSPTNRIVLLPAFIGWSPREGSGVFDPIRQADADPRFYSPNPNLTVDLEALEQAMAKFRPRVVVVIHYFGRTDPNLAKLGELVRRYDAILVEDLAHGFFSASRGGSAGRIGDFSIFSIHKMFATTWGGMVRYRKASMITTQKGTAQGLAEFVSSYNWEEISLRRRSNFVAISALLAESSIVESSCEMLWPSLDLFDVPQTLPVKLRTANRDDVYHAMNAGGFGMTSLYHTMIQEVHNDFPEMMNLARSIINFPVHQDMVPEQANALVASFESAILNARLAA